MQITDNWISLPDDVDAGYTGKKLHTHERLIVDPATGAQTTVVEHVTVLARPDGQLADVDNAAVVAAIGEMTGRLDTLIHLFRSMLST